MKPTSQIRDLCKLACDRSEKAVELVTQLLDDDDTDTACVLMTVAADNVLRAAYYMYMSDEDMTEDQALGKVLHAMVGTLGISKVAAAFKTIKLKEQTK